jgi:hypothetical protein
VRFKLGSEGLSEKLRAASRLFLRLILLRTDLDAIAHIIRHGSHDPVPFFDTAQNFYRGPVIAADLHGTIWIF